MVEYGSKPLVLGPLSHTVFPEGLVQDATGKDVFSGAVDAALAYAQTNCKSGGLVKLSDGKFKILKNFYAYRHTYGGENTLLVPGASMSSSLVILAQPGNSPTAPLQEIIFGGVDIDCSGYVAKVDTADISKRSNFFGGIQARNSKNVVIRDCSIKNAPASHGVQLQASTLTTVERCLVDTVGHETNFGAYGNGICSGEMFKGYSAHHNLIQDCIIKNPSMVCVNWEPGNDNMCINVQGFGTKSGKFYDLDKKWKYQRWVTIWKKGGFADPAGNEFYDCTYEGLGLEISVNGARTKIHGGRLKTTGLNGENYTQILVNGDRGAHYFVMEGCEMDSIDPQSCIQLLNSNNASIQGNTFIALDGKKTQFAVEGSTNNSIIKDNACTGYKDPIVSVTGTGNTISNNGPPAPPPAKPIVPGASGVNDQCVVAWNIEGLVGQNRLFIGSDKVDPTTALNATSINELAKKIMFGLATLCVRKFRFGAADKWSSETMYGLWKANPTKFFDILDKYVYWAGQYGIQVTITALGYADDGYHPERIGIFDTGSDEFFEKMAYVGAIANHFGGNTTVDRVEVANEPDADVYAAYWLKKYPDYATRLVAYSAWVKAAVDTAGEYAGEGHAPIGMGHALIGAMFCASAYTFDTANKINVTGWDFIRNGKDFLKAPNDPLPHPTFHPYWFGASISDFTKDWIKPFADYCQGRGVKGYAGEFGDLRTGAAWHVKDVEDALKAAGVDAMAMRLAPRAGFPMTMTQFPDDTPAPGSTIPSEPTSTPGQETTTETPSSGVEPNGSTGETSTPSVDTNTGETPANGATNASEDVVQELINIIEAFLRGLIGIFKGK